MKQALFILLSLKTMTLIAQQSEIKGIISIHNSEYETGKRQYVSNAQVEDEFAKANPQTTDANGNFKLVFVRVPEKTSVQLIVKKADLQVVNIDGLSTVTGQRDVVRLSMAKPDKIAEYRRQIYQVGKSEAEKNLAAQLKKKGEQITTLQKDAVKNKTAIEKLQKEYAELQAFASKIEEQAKDLARRYAPINLDDAAPLYRESFRLFQKGELDKALQILKGAGLIDQANKIIAERKNIKNIRNEADQRDSIQQQRTKDLNQVLGLKADLHEAKFEWDSVLFCLELRLNLDSNNVDNLWAFAFFLADQQEHSRSIKLYQKFLKLARTPSEKSVALNNMAGIYNFLRNDAEASECIKEALKISEPLAAQNPDLYAKDLAMNLITLALIYQSNAKFKEAEESFIKSLKIYKNLAEKNPETYLSDVGTGLQQLGFFYINSGRFQEAEAVLAELPELIARLHAINPNELTFKFSSIFSDTTLNADQKYKDLLSILSKFAGQNPKANMPWLGYSHMMASDIFIGNKQWEDAVRNVSEAISIYRKLAKEKPESFLHHLAHALTKLGDLEKTLYNVNEANNAFKEASALFRKLSSQKPDVYLPQLAYAQYCLGNTFQAIYEIDHAEKAFLEASDIYKKLADANLANYSFYLANTYNDLAVLYQNKFEDKKAEPLLIKALDLYKELEQKQGLNPKLSKAMALNNLGLNYQRKGDNKAAESAYRASLTLHEQVENENPESNLFNLAICQSNLGYIYTLEQKKEEAEKLLTQALKSHIQLEKSNGDRFAINKAIVLNILGNFHTLNNEVEKGVPYLEESVKINEKLYQAGNTQLRNQLASELGNLSWWELFARQFDKAEGYGLRCVSLDNTQIWVWTNIGHARFLNGKIEDAKNAWFHLKGIKDNAGKDFKVILQEDWTAIEKAGIVQLDTFEPAKKWLTETW